MRYGILNGLGKLCKLGFQFPQQLVVRVDLAVQFTTVSLDALQCKTSGLAALIHRGLLVQPQHAIPGQYAKEHGFTNCRFFIDDGYSGINFDRPTFTEMMELVEQRRVRTIIVKDLSRLGLIIWNSDATRK